MSSKGRIEKAQTSYYLPAGYQAEWTHGMLVLRRPDGSAVATLYGKQVIGEIIERYAWEDSAEPKRCRVERASGSCNFQRRSCWGYYILRERCPWPYA